jgi:hypothetical protein
MESQILNLNKLSALQVSPEQALEMSTIASHSLAVEPRFTSTVSWIVPPAAPKQKKSNLLTEQNVNEGEPLPSRKKRKERKIEEVEPGNEAKQQRVRFEVLDAMNELEQKTTKEKVSKKKEKGKNKSKK